MSRFDLDELEHALDDALDLSKDPPTAVAEIPAASAADSQAVSAVACGDMGYGEIWRVPLLGW